MDDCGRTCDCKSAVSRRDFLKFSAGTAGLIYGTQGAKAAPGDIPSSCRVPAPQTWFDQLTQPGRTMTYTGDQLKNILFPLGGIGTGTVWLNGGGKLVNWQIFNNIQKSALVDDSFFAIRIEQDGRPPVIRVLRQEPLGPFAGISNVRFVGRYPVAQIVFVDPELPVGIELEAFNPMIPLNEKDSAIPCAIFNVRVVNKSDQPVRVSVLGTLQNAVGHAGKEASVGVAYPTYGGNVNKVVFDDQITAVGMAAEQGSPAEIHPPITLLTDHNHIPAMDDSPVRGLTIGGVGEEGRYANLQRVYWLANGDLRFLGGAVLKQIATGVREYGGCLLISGLANPLMKRVQASASSSRVFRRETLFASFDDNSFGQWTAEGDAFKRPQTGAVGAQQPVSGFLGQGLVNSFDSDDIPKGKLLSPDFIIKERYISFLIGGGNHPNACCMNLVVDGKVVRTATGKNSEHLERAEWDVDDLGDQEATIEIVDSKSNPWGHILVDDIRFSNLRIDEITVEEADAWNNLLQEPLRAESMVPISVGKGRVLIVPVELGTPKAGVDALRQRDQALGMVASLAQVEFRRQVGWPQDAPSFGTMCLGVPEHQAGVKVAWTDRDELFNEFAERGTFAQPPGPTDPGVQREGFGPTEPGQTLNSALCVQREVKSGQQTSATFVYAWHFPNQYYPQNNYQRGNNRAVFVGNMYDNWYRGALDVMRIVLKDLDYLRECTYRYRDAMFDTTLPQYFVDAVAANASIIRSPTCFWTKDGTFFGFEGCVQTGGGCCPMNCNHVWNYEHSLSRLWPAIELDMRKTELKFHQLESGGTHHRVAVPRDNPAKHAPPVADGQCGAVLKVYREHLQSADRRFLDDYWPHVRKAMDFAIAEWDPDHDGVMEKPQFNTYDRVIFGHNSFVSSLYLAALVAAEKMARLQNENELADHYHALFERGYDKISKQLFNGEYYVQKADNLTGGYGDGCWSDQVVGQWWARILDLGDILPNDQVRSALKAIFKYNFLWKTDGFEGTQRFLQFGDGDDKGLLCGSWPKGGRPADPMHYRDEYWTGVEYQVASHKIYEGQIVEALAMVKGARERYDGRKKSPWNEIECGDYYVRAMSSWALLLASQGCVSDGPACALTLDPRLSPDDHRSFFSTAQGWGQFVQQRAAHKQVVSLAVMYGRCDIRELRLGVPADAKALTVRARQRGRETTPDAALRDGLAVLDMGGQFTIEAGDALQIVLEW